MIIFNEQQVKLEFVGGNNSKAAFIMCMQQCPETEENKQGLVFFLKQLTNACFPL